MNVTCFYDQTPFTLSMEEKIAALRKMHAENLHHYDARCPRCGRANAISRERLEMFTPGWEEAIKAPAASPMTPAKSESAGMPSMSMPSTTPARPMPAMSMPAAAAPAKKAAPARRRHPAAKKAAKKATKKAVKKPAKKATKKAAKKPAKKATKKAAAKKTTRRAGKKR
jgi:hypothetical protein